MRSSTSSRGVASDDIEMKHGCAYCEVKCVFRHLPTDNIYVPIWTLYCTRYHILIKMFESIEVKVCSSEPFAFWRAPQGLASWTYVLGQQEASLNRCSQPMKWIWHMPRGVLEQSFSATKKVGRCLGASLNSRSRPQKESADALGVVEQSFSAMNVLGWQMPKASVNSRSQP